MSSINFDFTADSQPRRQAVQCCTERHVLRHRRFVSSTTRRNVRDGLGPVGAAAVMSDTNSPAQAQADANGGQTPVRPNMPAIGYQRSWHLDCELRPQCHDCKTGWGAPGRKLARMIGLAD
jgi:hypothetical protein